MESGVRGFIEQRQKSGVVVAAVVANGNVRVRLAFTVVTEKRKCEDVSLRDRDNPFDNVLSPSTAANKFKPTLYSTRTSMIRCF